jgi:hypothetical protein
MDHRIESWGVIANERVASWPIRRLEPSRHTLPFALINASSREPQQLLSDSDEAINYIKHDRVRNGSRSQEINDTHNSIRWHWPECT